MSAYSFNISQLMTNKQLNFCQHEDGRYSFRKFNVTGKELVDSLDHEKSSLPKIQSTLDVQKA